MPAYDTALRSRKLAEPMAPLQGAARLMLFAAQAVSGDGGADAVPALAELSRRFAGA